MPHALLAVLPILAGIGFVSLGNGVLGTFLPIRLGLDGMTPAAIGMVVTGFPLGFLAGCALARGPVARLGAVRAFALLGGLMALATLGYGLVHDPLAWTAFRAVNGFGAAVLYTITESWLNARTPPAARGVVLAVYMISDKLTYATGQMLIGTQDSAGPALFFMAAAFHAACLLPVWLAPGESPLAGRAEPLALRALLAISPLGVAATFASGLANMAAVGLGPVWAAANGMAVGDIPGFMSAMMLGGLAAQWPVGWLSDRFDRRRVVLGVTVAAALLAAALGLGGQAPHWAQLALSALFGAAAFTIYPVAVAHANDHAGRAQAVALSRGMLLSWAVGSVAGPPLASALMEFAGPGGLFVHVVLANVGLALFVAARIARGAPALGPELRP